jgi:hypothetical protein
MLLSRMQIPQVIFQGMLQLYLKQICTTPMKKKLIWSGISETIDPTKASEVIGSLGKVLVDKLDSEGFLAN